MKKENCNHLVQEPMRACSYAQVTISEPYLINAFEKTGSYLLSLDPDKLMVGFMETAGWDPDAVRYPGWESTEIQGHTLGHYLAALSQAYAATGRRAFGERVEKICKTLRSCQREDGYLFAWKEEIFDRVENHQPAWVPWYTFHKILAGFITAYEQTGNTDAYVIAGKMGDWTSERVLNWSEKVQREVLAVEYGGMNDALYELYKITKDRKYFEAAHRFDEEELFQKLYEGKDVLNNLHANTTIPKILGAMNRYLITKEDYYYTVAENFWNMVVNHHTYITGGNSEWEHFGKPDILDGERTACNSETCNVHNMLKLTKRLYSVSGDRKYMDFYERAWMNAILGSQNPETGMTMYFQPMETGMFKVYQDPYSDFWCCTGTGMENFTKLQDSVYFTDGEALYITRYISCQAEIPELQTTIDMKVHFPETDHICMHVNTRENRAQKLFFRIPEWSGERITITIDEKKCESTIQNGYLEVSISGSGRIEIRFDPKVRAHTLPDNRHAAAFTYGPMVLCGTLGKDRMDITLTGVQVKVPVKKKPVKDYLVLENEEPEVWLEQIGRNLVRTGRKDQISFMLRGTDEDSCLRFIPYYQQYQERYGIYWILYQKDSDELKKRTSEQNQKQRIEDIAMDIIPVGNDQYELAHNVQGKGTEASREYGYNYRWIQGEGYFQYEMLVDPEGCMLAVTYGSYDAGNEFDILIDDKVLVHEKLMEKEKELYTRYYEIPGEMLNGKNRVTVTFRTVSDHARCRIFQVLYTCGIDKKREEEEK